MHYLEIALSHGWPDDARDVQQLSADTARRAHRYAEAAEHQTRTLPPATRQAGGADVVRQLYAALADPALRPSAIAALDALNATAADMDSFTMLMFSMTWYTLLGDVDRAYEVSERWLAQTRRAGSVGIPFNFGFWLAEMRPFRADPRFEELSRRMGLLDYWRRFGPPDDCRLQGAALVCG
jgi:hypothetical protein